MQNSLWDYDKSTGYKAQFSFNSQPKGHLFYETSLLLEEIFSLSSDSHNTGYLTMKHLTISSLSYNYVFTYLSYFFRFFFLILNFSMRKYFQGLLVLLAFRFQPFVITENSTGPLVDYQV